MMMNDVKITKSFYRTKTLKKLIILKSVNYSLIPLDQSLFWESVRSIDWCNLSVWCIVNHMTKSELYWLMKIQFYPWTFQSGTMLCTLLDPLKRRLNCEGCVIIPLILRLLWFDVVPKSLNGKYLCFNKRDFYREWPLVSPNPSLFKIFWTKIILQSMLDWLRGCVQLLVVAINCTLYSMHANLLIADDRHTNDVLIRCLNTALHD